MWPFLSSTAAQGWLQPIFILAAKLKSPAYCRASSMARLITSISLLRPRRLDFWAQPPEKNRKNLDPRDRKNAPLTPARRLLEHAIPNPLGFCLQFGMIHLLIRVYECDSASLGDFSVNFSQKFITLIGRLVTADRGRGDSDLSNECRSMQFH